MDNEKKEKEEVGKYGKVAVYTGIPSTLLASLIVGWLIGKWFDERFHGDGKFMAVGLILGMAAGFYEVFRIVKKIG